MPITSTELSSVLGLNPYKSKAALWREKKDPEAIQEEKPLPWPAQRGIAFEEEALRSALIGWLPLGNLEPVTVGMVEGRRDPWSGERLLACSPDLVLLGGDLDLPWISGVEAKVPLPHNIPRTVEALPAQHLVQVAACLVVLRADEWHLFYYDPDAKHESQMYKLTTHDHEGLERFLENAVRSFLGMAEEPKRTTKHFKDENLKKLLGFLEIKRI